MISTEDHTNKELKTLIDNKYVVMLQGDKDSRIVIMNKIDCIKKLETTIEEGNKNATIAQTEDTAVQDLKLFQEFLHRSFKKYEHYD